MAEITARYEEEIESVRAMNREIDELEIEGDFEPERPESHADDRTYGWIFDSGMDYHRTGRPSVNPFIGCVDESTCRRRGTPTQHRWRRKPPRFRPASFRPRRHVLLLPPRPRRFRSSRCPQSPPRLPRLPSSKRSHQSLGALEPDALSPGMRDHPNPRLRAQGKHRVDLASL